MELRLYKNCKLTQEYDNVFNSKSVFESYLETLDATAYDINLETSYYSVQSDGTGSIPIDFNYVSDGQILGHINEYNYIRFTDSNYNIVRYCFVTSIAIQNGIAIINYLEDVWHNYAFDLSYKANRISQSTDTTIKTTRKLVEAYSSTDSVQVSGVSNIGSITSSGYKKVIAVGQFYIPTAAGTPSNRVSFVAGIGSIELQDTISYETFDEILWFLKFQSLSNIVYINKTPKGIDLRNALGISIDDLSTKVNYEISNIYVVPGDWNYDNDIFMEFPLPAVDCYIEKDFEGDTSSYHGFTFSLVGERDELHRPILSYKIDTDDPYRITAIGNYSTTISFNYNSNEVRVGISFVCDGTNIRFYWLFNNTVYEVTEDYEYEFPIDFEASELLQLKSINRKLANAEYERMKISLVADTFSGVGQFATGLITLNPGTIANSGAEVAKSFVSAKNAQQRLEKITNASLYTSNSMTVNTSIAVANSYYSLFVFSIQPQNEESVNKTTELYGYVTSYIDEIFDETTKAFIINAEAGATPKYVYLCLTYSELYGHATNEIIKEIKSILQRGVRIWQSNIDL